MMTSKGNAGDKTKRMAYIGPQNVSIVITQGDITKFKVDAIVNAANQRMLGGGGVDGAIHNAAGPQLRKYIAKNVPEVRNDERCPPGHAISTPAFDLTNVKHIIHTVGPIYASDSESRPVLQAAFSNSLKEAVDIRAQSVAFPAISCGIYGYPVSSASQIAMRTVKTFLLGSPEAKEPNGQQCASPDAASASASASTTMPLQKIMFVLFGEKEYKAFDEAAKEHFEEGGEK